MNPFIQFLIVFDLICFGVYFGGDIICTALAKVRKKTDEEEFELYKVEDDTEQEDADPWETEESDEPEDADRGGDEESENPAK